MYALPLDKNGQQNFESHNKLLKQPHIIVCFSVLSISFAFTILPLDKNGQQKHYFKGS
jgi:hypothetical protein